MGFGSHVYSNLEIDVNNTLAMRQSVAEQTGYKSCRISEREITGKIDPEAVDAVATFNPASLLFNNNMGQLSATVGTTPGNIVSISSNNVHLVDIDDEDRDELTVDSLSFELVEPEYSASSYSELTIISK